MLLSYRQLSTPHVQMFHQNEFPLILAQDNYEWFK